MSKLNKTKIGKLIKKSRLKAKLSQEQLGEVVDLTRTTVNRLEQGCQWPSFITTVRIYKTLGVNLLDVA